MKKLILIIIAILSMFSISYSQEEVYPKYVSDSTGTYVLMTVEQARQIDNDLELLYTLQGVMQSSIEGGEICIKVIDKLKREVELLNLKIGKLEEINERKSDKIDKLNRKIDELSKKGDLYETQIGNSEEIIKEKDNIIKKQKRQKIVAFIVAIGAMTLLIIK